MTSISTQIRREIIDEIGQMEKRIAVALQWKLHVDSEEEDAYKSGK